MMLLIWAGVTSALFAGVTSDLRARDYLKGRAQTIANALSSEQIRALRGGSQDLTSLSYVQVKERLQEIKTSNPDLRFVYLMGQQNNNVFYYVNSENTDSRNYTSPGQAYDNPTNELLGTFSSEKAFTEGPVNKKWGVAISGLAPIVDTKTRQTIAVVGVDTSALHHYGQVLLYALVPLLLVAIPFAGLLRDIKIQSKEQEILRLKEQFVSIASHELRSPLTGMLWAIQSLSRGSASKLNLAQLSLLGDMFRSTESSLNTVNEILDMSIFERGKAGNLKRLPVDFVAAIKQAVGTLKLGATEKNLHIEPVGVWPRQVYTSGDAAAIKRALMNILSNAIKYSPPSSTIELSYQANVTEHIVSIKDHGIGIPEGEQTKVLDGYYRATNATVMEAHGTGLGLWVTRKIIEQHGGRLWLESKLDHGTTIFVALPIVKFTGPGRAPLAGAGSLDLG